MSVGIVMPVGPGREANVTCALTSLYKQTSPPDIIVIVEDGVFLQPEVFPDTDITVLQYNLPSRHQPGLEQPRNVGVRIARNHIPDLDYVWFVDSDIVMEYSALENMLFALQQAQPQRIMAGPYEWLGGNKKRPDVIAEDRFYMKARKYKNDPRWALFNSHGPEHVYTNDLSAGLACFSGNLIWPVSEFERVGGFWSQIHHGRCEDGELGLRAVAMDVPISFCATARGYHLEHSVNGKLALERNERDVPMLNDRHPWMQQGGVFMVDRDGKSFDVMCACGQQVTTIGWWEHAWQCAAVNGMELLAHP